MKVISSKNGSSRERIDVEADLLPIASWRVAWEDSQSVHGYVKPGARHVVLSSQFGAERSSELWLTEAEAIAIARLVTDDLLITAAKSLTQRETTRG